MELFALDLGNIQTKIKSSKLEKVLPSKFAYYEDLGNQSTSISKSNLDIKEYKVNFDDDFTYAWGSDINKAKVKRFTDTIAFENRYSTPNFKLLANFAIGELAKDFPEAKDNILNVNIVTGVPTDEFNERSVMSIMKVLKGDQDRKSTRLNSSNVAISYAVFCLKKKKERQGTGPTWAAWMSLAGLRNTKNRNKHPTTDLYCRATGQLNTASVLHGDGLIQDGKVR